MSKLKWINKDAIEAYNDLIKQIKRKPSARCTEKDGIAIWSKKKLSRAKWFGSSNCFEEVIIRDESIIHKCPSNHRNFLYGYVKIAVKPTQVSDLMSISHSIGYDPLKNLVYARCASIHAVIATLVLATDMLLGKVTLKKIHKNELYKEIIYSIYTSNDPDEKNVAALYKRMCANVKKLQKETLNKGFWTNAYSISKKNLEKTKNVNKL